MQVAVYKKKWVKIFENNTLFIYVLLEQSVTSRKLSS